MEKQQIELFKAIRGGDIEKARRAYEKGANVNMLLDRWMIRGRPHWGLRVHVKPMGVYLGFSARESWSTPLGEDAHRGDTLIMAALKCRKTEEVRFLLGCDRLNLNCRNEAGNSALDIARATGQEFLMRDTFSSSAAPVYSEALPAWQQEAHATTAGQAAPGTGPGLGVQGGPGGFPNSTVVAEAVPVSGPQASLPPYYPEADTPGAYATAEPVGQVHYGQTGSRTDEPVYMASSVQPVRNPVGPAVDRPSPYDPADGRGRARLMNRGGVGTARGARNVYGFF